MIRMLPRLVFPCVALVLWLATAGISQEKLLGPRALPGDGVVEPSGKTGFFPNTSGGIDALDLATGNVLWTSNEANRPLFAAESRLFAQKGNGQELKVVAMDTRKEGQRVFESPAIPLPGWVSVQPAYGRTFRSVLRMDSDKRSAFLIWEARAFYAGGAAPPPEIERRARKNGSGVVRIDVDTGKLEPLDAEKIAAGNFFPVPADANNPTVGMLTFEVKDGPALNPNKPFERRRTLQAVTEAKKIVWKRDVAAPIFLPPLP